MTAEDFTAEDPGSPFLGFVLATHNHPEQVAYLCRKLSAMFNDPPIAIHHDYSKGPLPPESLPPNVSLVADWIQTSWGKLSIVQAFLAAMRILHASNPPQWTICLSSADYPVKSAAAILHDLRSTGADAFLDYRPILRGGLEPADARSSALPYKQPSWMVSANERYVALNILPFAIRKHIGMRDRELHVQHRWLTRLFTPFSNALRPFGGDMWSSLNRKAVAALLQETDASRKLLRHYRRRPIPDESYFHTILLNRPDLRVENDNHRYTHWEDGAAHPRLLGYADIPALVASNAHFARKFPFSPVLYAAVDAAVDAAEGHAAVRLVSPESAPTR